MPKKLMMEKLGNNYPSVNTYDLRHNVISNNAISLNSTPLYYINNRVNNLGSSFNNSGVTLKFGISNELYDIYGNLKNSKGVNHAVLYPTNYLTVDNNGNYKINMFGKNYKIYNDKNGYHFKHNKNKVYLN